MTGDFDLSGSTEQCDGGLKTLSEQFVRCFLFLYDFPHSSASDANAFHVRSAYVHNRL